MRVTDIRKYLLEENLEIRITPKYVDIVNYKELGHFDNKSITIYHNDGNVKISGDSLTISKLLNKEVLIIGDIKNIELR
ncbi:MAG: YabP/YqfC family sporulation protein [Bacilli bacterium]|nr:YabP/YqfC family sporulation protein [Bacilli bacterium]